jgi:hypothetical protein
LCCYEALEATVIEAINPAVQIQLYAACPGVFDDGSAGEVFSLGHHIQFTEPIATLFWSQLLQVAGTPPSYG